MSNKTYIYPVKTLSQSRSKFKMPHTLKTSFMHGDFNLFEIIEVLPDDTWTEDPASLIRMSTPIAPIMDNIVMHLAAFFVPCRLVYDNWEQLMGANKTGAWTDDDNEYKIPKVGFSPQPVTTFSAPRDCYWSQAGLPRAPKINFPAAVNALPFRALALVWNEFYRNQNVSAPLPIDHSSANKVLVTDSGNIVAPDATDFIFNDLLKLGKYADQFTKCLPEPQKHDPVSFIPEDLLVGSYFNLEDIEDIGDNISLYTDNVSSVDDETGFASFGAQDGEGAIADSVYAKTTQRAWNNINALRFAFQLQKFYEKDARYGTRYFEMLNGHFGVTNPDLTLQRPQFLGEMNWRINIDQVLSTAGYAASDATTVGAPGANSVTGKKGSLYTGSFSEHGYIIVVGGTRHQHTYSNRIDPMWLRSDRLDFYDPVFANIGEQPVYTCNLDCRHVSSPLKIFGYQEAWYEYRMIADMVTGILDPYDSNSLDFWTLADKYAAEPLLNADFIYENRDSISRALVTGDTGPDFIADFYFDCTAVRALPMFSIPGLADHH